MLPPLVIRTFAHVMNPKLPRSAETGRDDQPQVPVAGERPQVGLPANLLDGLFRLRRDERQDSDDDGRRSEQVVAGVLHLEGRWGWGRRRWRSWA